MKCSLNQIYDIIEFLKTKKINLGVLKENGQVFEKSEDLPGIADYDPNAFQTQGSFTPTGGRRSRVGVKSDSIEEL